MKIIVIGAGAWGTALAVSAARNPAGHQVVLWARDGAQAQAMAEQRENARYLPGIPLPRELHVRGGDIDGLLQAAPRADLLIIATPVAGLRETLQYAEVLLNKDDVDAKADWVRNQLSPRLTAESVTWTRGGAPTPDADTEEGASTLLRCTVMDPQADPCGKAFTAPAVEIGLASYPGFTLTAPPGRPTPFGVYRPAYVERSAVEHTVVHADGRREVIADPTVFGAGQVADSGRRPSPYPAPPDSLTRRMPLGTFVHARSGDKGGDANLGLWVARDGVVAGAVTEELYAARATWLAKLITPRKIRELVPEAEALDVEVYVLPNLGGVNVLIRGLLGRGVAASTRFDPQAKALGEWIRSRIVHIQEDLL